MTSIGRSIDDLYFHYRPVAGHVDGCKYRDTNLWETTRFTWVSFDGERTETTIRYACRECGMVSFDHVDNAMSYECTHASQVGYASKPERALGVWLHPGPRIWYGDERGPMVYLVTASKEPPQRPEDVVGKVGWHLGPRGGVRWGAGLGCTGHGTVLTGADQDWASRRAAVAWVIENAPGGVA